MSIDSCSCANIANRYIYTDFLAILWLQARAKIVDYCKTQVVNYVYFYYKSK